MGRRWTTGGEFLDGLRGLAALYVLLHHAYMMVAWRGDGAGLPPGLRGAAGWLGFGQVAVDVFIVLFGYCLMLPVAGSEEGRLRGGLEEFIQRRARRILPPYYAALAASLALLALVPGLRHVTGSRWDAALPVSAPWVLVSHLFLLHNLSADTAYKIDYPMWSVATEWQLYFVFALLLLPIYRKLGITVTVAAAFVVGALLDIQYPFADFHFLGLFALGAAGAVVAVRPDQRLLKGCPWGTVAAVIAIDFVLSTRYDEKLLWDPLYGRWLDALLGVATVCLILHCVRHLQCVPAGRRPNLLLRLLQSRAAVGLGAFSYSLYLAHAPILGLVYVLANPFHLTPAQNVAVQFLFGVPLALLASWAFHLAFERPFVARRRPEAATEEAYFALRVVEG